jgi:hypothetical protein
MYPQTGNNLSQTLYQEQSAADGGAEHFVGGEHVAPLTEVQVVGEDGGGALVAFGDQLVEAFVFRMADGLGQMALAGAAGST